MAYDKKRHYFGFIKKKSSSTNASSVDLQNKTTLLSSFALNLILKL